MKEEIVSAAQKLTDVVDRMSVAAQGSALHMAGAVVTIRRWLRACNDIDNDELAVFTSEIEQAIEKIEEQLADQMRYSEQSKDIAGERLNIVLQRSSEILQQSAAHNVDPINDPTVRAQVWGLTGGKCAYCEIDLAPDKQGNGETNTFCVEHVVPVSYGGPNNIRNYVPSCRSCNNSKSDKHVLTFIRNSLPARMERADLRLVSNGDRDDHR